MERWSGHTPRSRSQIARGYPVFEDLPDRIGEVLRYYGAGAIDNLKGLYDVSAGPPNHYVP